MFKTRYLEKYILDDLKQKMVFIGGPRQVGKTTLAKHAGSNIYKTRTYLNWDDAVDRDLVLHGRFPSDTDLIIFDEIHKYRLWKNLVKGIYDTRKELFKIIVTGSARLDVYRRGGDSMQGRYHYHRLHPFSLRESLGKEWAVEPFQELPFLPDENLDKNFSSLFEFGGFPEPFLAKDKQVLRRFHNERLDRLVRGDIRDMENIQDLSSLQVLADLLPYKVGSLLSLASLQTDLSVAYKTIARWVETLEKFYYHYRIYPYKNKAVKSLKKQPKMYMWDWSQVKDEPARLENMVASHLLKTAHLLNDFFGYKAELHFLHDIDGREVDFLLTVANKPWLAVEVKQSERGISPHLKYFSKKFEIPFLYQVVLNADGVDYTQDGVRIMGLKKFLSGLV